MIETYLDCDHVVGRSLNVAQLSLAGLQSQKTDQDDTENRPITSGDQFKRIRSGVTQVKNYVAFFLPSKRMLSQF